MAIPIEYICFTGQCGYGFAARNYILAMHKSNLFDIRIVSLDSKINKGITIQSYDLFRELENKPENKDAIQIYHCIPDFFRRVKAKERKIAVATFEANAVPPYWFDLLKSMNALIAPSAFCKNIFSCSNKEISVIPHCLDFELYKGTNNRNKRNIFRFLFCGAWKKRKNIESLIEAFREEFYSYDNVSLTIKSSSPTNIKDSIHPKILYIRTVYADEYMPDFFANYDCMVNPSLGEGYGYAGLQALACNMSLVTTNYSGIKEYANSDNSILLEPEGMTHNKCGCMDNYIQFKNCSWPFISIGQISKKMRLAFQNRKECEEKSSYIYENIKEKFGYNKIANKMYDLVLTIFPT